eukprot:scaffold240950_cov54-Attheya_sp.AAC.1
MSQLISYDGRVKPSKLCTIVRSYLPGNLPNLKTWNTSIFSDFLGFFTPAYNVLVQMYHSPAFGSVNLSESCIRSRDPNAGECYLVERAYLLTNYLAYGSTGNAMMEGKEDTTAEQEEWQ